MSRRSKKMELPKELKMTKSQASLGDSASTGDIFFFKENINHLVGVLNGFKPLATFKQPYEMFFLGEYEDNKKEYFEDGRNDKEILLYYYLRKYKAKVVPISGNIQYNFNTGKTKNVPVSSCIFINPKYKNYALLLKVIFEGEHGIINEIYNEYDVKNKEYFDLLRPYIEGILYGYTALSTKGFISETIKNNKKLKKVDPNLFYNQMKKDADISIKKWLTILNDKKYQKNIQDYEMPLIKTWNEHEDQLLEFLKR